MTLRAYIWGLRIVSLLSFSALALVVYLVDPERSGLMGVLVFYVVLFFALSALFNLVFLRLRKSALGSEAALSNLSLSFRQGILLAIFVIGLLILQSFRVLVWWDGLILLLAVFLVEFYFLSRD